MLREFRKLNLPNFRGDPNPLVAHKWLRQVRKLMDILRMPVEYRVTIAASLFEGEADYWWESIQRNRDVEVMT